MMVAETRAFPFAGLAARKLRREPPGFLEPQANPRGDHELEPDGRPYRPPILPKPAAVLVPIVTHADEPSVLLTERASNLRDHSGQISFPGGKMDESDDSPLATALRESEEEVGLERRHVSPLGYLDAYLSSSNYFVIPAVALVSPGMTLSPNPREVADTFEVPLDFLMDPGNHELHSREWKGRIRQYYAIPFRERYIWGVTAGILRNLYERLYGP